MGKLDARLPGILAEKFYSLWGSNYKYVFCGILLLSLLPILFGGCPEGGEGPGDGGAAPHPPTS